MDFPFLETKRLKLRKLTPEVYNFIFNNFNDAELSAFFHFKDEIKLAEEKDRFRKGITTYRTSFVNFQMIEKSSGNFIGACGFHTWYIDHDRAEIGYAIAEEEYKGRGYMSEAVSAIVKYGFYEMNLNRIEAFISPENTPSSKILEKLGFKCEGKLREHYKKDGNITDSLVYGLIKSGYTG